MLITINTPRNAAYLLLDVIVGGQGMEGLCEQLTSVYMYLCFRSAPARSCQLDDRSARYKVVGAAATGAGLGAGRGVYAL